jgi:hypothetical protein
MFTVTTAECRPQQINKFMRYYLVNSKVGLIKISPKFLKYNCSDTYNVLKQSHRTPMEVQGGEEV